jgi:hypothetical protein
MNKSRAHPFPFNSGRPGGTANVNARSREWSLRPAPAAVSVLHGKYMRVGGGVYHLSLGRVESTCDPWATCHPIRGPLYFDDITLETILLPYAQDLTLLRKIYEMILLKHF